MSIHHGAEDEQVPPEWSAELYAQLRVPDKAVEYFAYPGAPYTFGSKTDEFFIQRMVAFFDRTLRSG